MKRTIWISGLVPAEGAEVYDGVRLAVADSEQEIFNDLAGWLEEAGDWDELTDSSVDVIREALNESVPSLITQWNVESREI